MLSFDHQPRTRIVFGPDRIDELGSLAAELGARRALVVSDPGIVAAGHTARGIESLRQAGLDALLFDQVHENPTTEHVEAGVVVARDVQPDLIIGLGGGSSMDCAKGINFLYSCGGRMQDYWGVGKATGPLAPMIAVPTTAGTGSEAQSFALISDAETHVKMACGDPGAAFRVAILDPKLTLTQPPSVTALTGADAIAHAVETYVTRRRNPMSLAYSGEAWRLLSTSFLRVLSNPDDLEARSAVQLGACFAGLAIENSMLGAAHALANPLTAQFNIVHGQAVSLMLPAIVRFNGQHHNSWYEELLQLTTGADVPIDAATGADGLADWLTNCVEQAGLKTRLTQLEIPQDALPRLAADAAKQWTATFNPREVDESSLLKLYEEVH